MGSLERWRARLGWSLPLAAHGRSAAWGSSVLALLYPALLGWANTNIYIQRQGCSSGLLPIPVALLDLGDGLAEWGTGRQLVWAEQDHERWWAGPQITKITIVIIIAIIYKVFTTCQRLE